MVRRLCLSMRCGQDDVDVLSLGPRHYVSVRRKVAVNLTVSSILEKTRDLSVVDHASRFVR